MSDENSSDKDVKVNGEYNSSLGQNEEKNETSDKEIDSNPEDVEDSSKNEVASENESDNEQKVGVPIKDSDKSINNPDTKKEKIWENAKKDGIGNSQSPVQCMRECLTRVFHNEDALRVFCQDWYGDFFKELKDVDRFSGIIGRLITYCDASGKTDHLWERVRLRNIKVYSVYYEKWKELVDITRKSEKYMAFKTTRTTRISRTPQQQEEKPHPLDSEDQNVIGDWFFNQLSESEKSLVISVALFEEIDRSYLDEITHDLEELLFS